ncbi:hypothetical protein NECAME_09137 [Necator americanus]|uniref:Uncharacterized protein n=1 Tax=Necator americanus TaxID=51031 RepID=W2TEI7_NECAM|nr:hypothetical protein NECAME_09137 [Necator americanus]ETN80465.1 hypothetical protein NECAME_09137 [Necator americanus]
MKTGFVYFVISFMSKIAFVLVGATIAAHAARVSLDRNNNAVRLDRQPRLIHNTSKHLNEGFFGSYAILSKVRAPPFHEQPQNLKL